MIFSEGAPQFKSTLAITDQAEILGYGSGGAIQFEKDYSMFENAECFWHEFHYFVSQLYYGEKIGVEIARKLRDGADTSTKRADLNIMLSDEIRHAELFKSYILDTFGFVFPRSIGMDRIVRLCKGSDDPILLAIVTHGVLEPCGMVTLKALRKFVKDYRFREFTGEVLRDEGHHISLICSNAGDFTQEYRNKLKDAVVFAFKSTASVGRAKELLQFFKKEGIEIGDIRPYETEVYKQKFDLSIRVVGKQLDGVGVSAF